jgi:benzoate membrane transport protein
LGHTGANHLLDVGSGLGMGLCSLVPSLLLRKPVMVAWSTPGAAVLASAGLAGGFSMAEAVGAFMVCAVLITLAGVTAGSSGS